MEKTPLPNLFIVGAAKAGTTSLHNYLCQHSDIFMSALKEPKYFSHISTEIGFNGPGDSRVLSTIIKNINDYRDLFKEASSYKIIGESSADYLYYHDRVVPEIIAEIGDPSILILIRNPADRAFSAYTHLRRDKREYLSFEKALDSEKIRISEGFEFIWHYKNAGFYYEQIKSYLNRFSRCKVILFEDLGNNTQAVVNDIFEFLGVYPININKEIIYNKSGIPAENWKSTLHNRIFEQKSIMRESFRTFIPSSIKRKLRFKLKNRLFDNNLVKPQMNPHTRKSLNDLYREDILKLQELIDRDLTSWLK